MTEGIKIALATGGFTVGGILITNLFNHFGPTRLSKKEKTKSINEERYNKVFSPIQRIIYFSTDGKYSMAKIKTIIHDNFNLVTDNLKKEFSKCINDETLTSEFIQDINIGCKYLENQLGYINSGLTAEEKKAYKNVVKELAFKKFSVLEGIISTIATVSTILTYFVSEKSEFLFQYLSQEQIDNIENFVTIILAMAMGFVVAKILPLLKRK